MGAAENDERREDAEEEEAQDLREDVVDENIDVVDDQSEDVDDQKPDDDESPRGKWCCSPRCGRGELQGEDRASERLDAIDDVGEAQSGDDHGKWTEVGDVSGETALGLRRRRRRRRRRCGAGSDVVGGGSTTLAPLTKTNSRGSAGGGALGLLALRGSRGQRSSTSRAVTADSSRTAMVALSLARASTGASSTIASSAAAHLGSGSAVIPSIFTWPRHSRL